MESDDKIILGQYYCCLCKSIIGYRVQRAGPFVLINHFVPVHGYTMDQVKDFDYLGFQVDEENPGNDQVLYDASHQRVAEMSVYWRRRNPNMEGDNPQ